MFLVQIKTKQKKPGLVIRRGTTKLCTTICILTLNRGLWRSSGVQPLRQSWCSWTQRSHWIQLCSLSDQDAFRWQLPLFITSSPSPPLSVHGVPVAYSRSGISAEKHQHVNKYKRLSFVVPACTSFSSKTQMEKIYYALVAFLAVPVNEDQSLSFQ